jgi:hypothetical protein
VWHGRGNIRVVGIPIPTACPLWLPDEVEDSSISLWRTEHMFVHVSPVTPGSNITRLSVFDTNIYTHTCCWSGIHILALT